MKSEQWRGLDFFNPEKRHLNVLIIGCGHIGSYLAFGLARMGVKDITVVDHDMVEPHNLPNQFFSETLVKDLPDKPTLYKVVALQQTIGWLVPTAKITPITSRIEAKTVRVTDYECVMVAVDDMNVRKWIWNEIITCNNPVTKLLIDARTGGQFANVFGIKLGHSLSVDVYNENLYDNSDVPELPCTGTSIIDVSFAVVANCIQLYRRYAKDKHIIGVHTFHDGIVGTTSIMRANVVPSDTNRTQEIAGVLNGDNVASPEREEPNG